MSDFCNWKPLQSTLQITIYLATSLCNGPIPTYLRNAVWIVQSNARRKVSAVSPCMHFQVSWCILKMHSLTLCHRLQVEASGNDQGHICSHSMCHYKWCYARPTWRGWWDWGQSGKRWIHYAIFHYVSQPHCQFRSAIAICTLGFSELHTLGSLSMTNRKFLYALQDACTTSCLIPCVNKRPLMCEGLNGIHLSFFRHLVLKKLK